MTRGNDDEIPRVAIMVPRHGNPCDGLHETLNYAVRDRSRIQAISEIKCKSSVLPKVFNDCLAIALNMRDQGLISHVAMCHADIAAEPGWLDILYNEMWTTGTDLMSTVIPIRGPARRTSTAIGLKEDRWSVPRCVMLKDRGHLPPTFGPNSVCKDGEVLLVNTGLFLADIRHPFWDRFAFQFHTRIKKIPTTPETVIPDHCVKALPTKLRRAVTLGDLCKSQDGIEWLQMNPGFCEGRISEARTEDYEMSHDLNDAGLKYMATFKPRVRHEGDGSWPNYIED